MNCIVVDDNEVVRKQVSAFIEKTGFLTCCGEFANPVNLASFIDENNVSLIFLDIEMPFMSGFDFLEKLSKDVQIIVISANSKYALEAYDYNITDYLLKPLTYTRFTSAVNKAVEKLIATKKTGCNLYFKINGNFVRISPNDILYCKVLDDNLEIFTTTRSVIVSDVIAESIQNNCKSFVWVDNDKFLVNLAKVESLSDDGHLYFNEDYCVADEIVVENSQIPELKNLIS